MTTYYVATTGSNGGNGSSGSPWKTISHAMQQSLKPGDTVIVRPGTYNESITIDNGGSAAGDVTLKSEVPGAALIRPPSGAWNAIYVWDDYVTIDGFDIGGATGDGIEANNVHHITVRNNTVHGSGESGIQFNWAEFITIENNETYGNARNGWFSGISIYETRNITGDTTTTGYRTIVKNNISYDNITRPNAGPHTDGNGIILDDFQSTQSSGHPNYNYPTLVEGNIVYNNGGKGIAVHWTDNVMVRNNTSYHNNQDDENSGTWRGEFSNQDGKNNVWVNNIAVADPTVNGNNTAIGFYGSGNAGTKWYNNITFNGTSGQASTKLEGGNNTILASDGNKLGVNPQFVDPAKGDFHIKAGSPAIDSGTGAHGVGSVDNDGNDRTVGPVDIGAYEHGSGGGGTTNAAPVARADGGFSTKAGVALTIDDAALLANDTDANGDTLSIGSVGSATNGTVRLNANGDVVFTPKSGYTGAASFGYTVADGKGGTDNAGVSLTVTSAGSVNTAPTITTTSALSVNENRTAVTTIAASDPDGDALTYAISGGADAARFRIDAKTGALSFVTAPNHEAPADAGANNVYNVSVSAADGVNAAVAKALSITVKDVAESDGGTSSFFGSTARPAETETRDPVDYELGMRFRTATDGEITELRYYRGAADAGDTDTRTMTLWTGNGTKLASGKVTSAAGDDGWQTVELASPVDVTAGTTYVVSYGTTRNYANTLNYFGSQKASADGMIVALANGGVFSDRGPGHFPTATWNKSNYWADVVLDPEDRASAPELGGQSIVGTGAADTLTGGSGDDVIRGLGGADRIIGAGGADTLSGGAGDDVFVYRDASESTGAARDVIEGFSRFHDTIDLSRIDAVDGGANNAFTWRGAAAFTDKAGELRSQWTKSGLTIQGDTDGDGAADFQIAIDASYHTFVAQDLIL